MNVTAEMLVAFGTVVANAAITFGVIKTRVDWVRADVAELQRRLDKMESRWGRL